MKVAYLRRWIEEDDGGAGRTVCAFDPEDNQQLEGNLRLGIPAIRFATIEERDEAFKRLRRSQLGL